MKIAITGTIGSGKSMVSSYLKNKGYTVFDCDEENRKLLNERAYELLGQAFPDCFIDKRLDKEKLSEKVFHSEMDRLKLESILHPEILKKLNQLEGNLIFAEVPLLFEVGWDIYFDKNLLLVVDEQTALARLKQRGLDYEDAKERIACQMPIDQKVKKADEIIYNNGTLFDLYEKIDQWLKKIIC